jgi:hypothetical protein
VASIHGVAVGTGVGVGSTCKGGMSAVIAKLIAPSLLLAWSMDLIELLQPIKLRLNRDPIRILFGTYNAFIGVFLHE